MNISSFFREKTKILIICLIFLANSAYSNNECSIPKPIEFHNHLLYRVIDLMSYHHGISIGRTDKVKEMIVRDLETLILDLDTMIKNTNCYSKYSKKNLNKVLILLAIMHRKRPVKRWSQSKKVQDAFRNSIKRDKKYYKKSLKRSWNKLL